MSNSAGKQAFLIVAAKISKEVLKRYYELTKATAALGDVFLLHHTLDNKIPRELKGIKIETFTDEILHNLGYKPIKNTLVPGSNHFPVLQFFLQHPEYTHYWCIEDDVVFNGKWEDFFENISSATDYDFITSHIRRNRDMPLWAWWKTLITPDGEIRRKEMLNSFNPIFRISNKALKYIDGSLKAGAVGHHEVLLPTLLSKAEFKIADFAAEDNHVTPGLSYCTLRTMRWKPVFFIIGNKKNTLYHPVKSKITFNQILEYLKRTIMNQKEYFK